MLMIIMIVMVLFVSDDTLYIVQLIVIATIHLRYSWIRSSWSYRAKEDITLFSNIQIARK
jgi:hypothetical protein